MRGVVMHTADDVRVQEGEDPKIIEPTDAIVKLTATCICGSDLWPYLGIEPVDHPMDVFDTPDRLAGFGRVAAVPRDSGKISGNLRAPAAIRLSASASSAPPRSSASEGARNPVGSTTVSARGGASNAPLPGRGPGSAVGTPRQAGSDSVTPPRRRPRRQGGSHPACPGRTHDSRPGTRLAVRRGQLPVGRYAVLGPHPWWAGSRVSESYLDHHAAKLVRRFDAGSHVTLAASMNSHDIGRGRGGTRAALSRVTARTLIAGVDSNRLYPLSRQAELAAGIPTADQIRVIESPYGHDGFLIEVQQVAALVRELVGWPARGGRVGLALRSSLSSLSSR